MLEKTSSYAADVTSTLFALFENFFGSLQDDMKVLYYIIIIFCLAGINIE